MTWRSLNHPNVLPLLGVKIDGKRFIMVSEWMVNGNINQFVEENPDADLLDLVSPFFGLLLPLVSNGYTIHVASRRH
jgi:hypothetical protein